MDIETQDSEPTFRESCFCHEKILETILEKKIERIKRKNPDDDSVSSSSVKLVPALT